MKSLSIKEYLSLKMPTEEAPVSDQSRILPDHSQLAEAKELLENIYCVQFASIPDFIIRMQAAKFIPHTDMSCFPSVQQKLSQ